MPHFVQSERPRRLLVRQVLHFQAVQLLPQHLSILLHQLERLRLVLLLRSVDGARVSAQGGLDHRALLVRHRSTLRRQHLPSRGERHIVGAANQRGREETLLG